MSKSRKKAAEILGTAEPRDHEQEYCGGRPVPMDGFEVAHRIANTVSNRKRFGDEVIDHPLNKTTTHPGRCNSAMNCGFRPDECRRIVESIERSKDGS